MLANGKQVLILIRHPPCYLYIQSSPVKLLAVIYFSIEITCKCLALWFLISYFSVQPNSPGAVMLVVVCLLDLQLHVQSVHITTSVVSSNPDNGEVYSIQHYEIKFVNDLRQIGGFLRVLRFLRQ